jgi:hypothetical protein
MSVTQLQSQAVLIQPVIWQQEPEGKIPPPRSFLSDSCIKEEGVLYF